MRTLLIALALCAVSAFAQPTFTQITDTIYTPVSGTLFNGTLQISNPVLVGVAGNTIGQWAYTQQITNGALSIQLAPTDTSTPPGTTYVFRFTPQLNNGNPWIEYCNVPTTGSTVTLAQMCATGLGAQVNLNQLTQSLATSGQIISFIGGKWIPSFVSQPLTTPSSSTAACTQNTLEYDANYLYICTATNNWRRAALVSF